MFEKGVEHGDLVIVGREQYSDLIRKSERIEAVKRLYESGDCYCLDTALSVLGIKVTGAQRVSLTADALADDGK